MRDMKEAVGSLLFWGLDIGGGALLSLVANPVWGALWITGVAIATFLIVFLRSPYRQRDEARLAVREISAIATLAERLDAIAKQIDDFMREFNRTKPSPRDQLNFAPPHLKAQLDSLGESNTIITPGADMNAVRMIKNSQDERRNHSEMYLERFREHLAPVAASRLRDAKSRGVLDETEFKQLVGLLGEDAYGRHAEQMYRDFYSKCREVAVRLREIEHQWPRRLCYFVFHNGCRPKVLTIKLRFYANIFFALQLGSAT